MSIQIRITSGPDAGKVFGLPLGKAVLIGRGKEADVRINDASVSRSSATMASVIRFTVVTFGCSLIGSSLRSSGFGLYGTSPA